MEEIAFEERDVIGEDTLDEINSAGSFNTCMYNTNPIIKGGCWLWEVGSGDSS